MRKIIMHWLWTVASAHLMAAGIWKDGDALLMLLGGALLVVVLVECEGRG